MLRNTQWRDRKASRDWVGHLKWRRLILRQEQETATETPVSATYQSGMISFHWKISICVNSCFIL